MKKNKYLISSGCSFTAGHTIGETASWATHLAQELDLELINFGKGGSGNELIVNKVIDYGTLRPDIAQDSLFVIQLTECLRYILPYESYEHYSKSIYTHITPNQFLRENGWDTWNKNMPFNKWIYDNRHVLAPIYLNITYSLQKTYNNIINLVNFCELSWDPNCLKHYENKRVIKTVSFNQARKPIYKSAIKSSNKYEKYLDKLVSNFNF